MNNAVTTMTPTHARPDRFLLTPEQERSCDELGRVMEWIYGPDWRPKGNGLLPAEPPVGTRKNEA